MTLRVRCGPAALQRHVDRIGVTSDIGKRTVYEVDVMSAGLLPRRQPTPSVVPLLLSFTAGFVDSCTALALFGLFVAQVTGSFVLVARAFVTHEQGATISMLAIPVFFLSAALTTALAAVVARRGHSALSWALGLECAMLTAFVMVALASAPISDPNAEATLAASLLGLFAMGVQSATVRLLMNNVASTNVMTTNTTQIAIDATELLLAWLACRTRSDAAAVSALQRSLARVASLFTVVLGFLLGTIAGTLAYMATGLWGLLAPLIIMYGMFGWSRTLPPGADLPGEPHALPGREEGGRLPQPDRSQVGPAACTCGGLLSSSDPAPIELRQFKSSRYPPTPALDSRI
jgi:uncharacterized membrane protein YoaK (UPF0700 family)